MTIRCTVACLCFLVTPSLHAQTTLRWKLQTGDHLDLAITQVTKSDVAYSGKKTTTNIDLTMHLTWRVLAAENGTFRLEQTLDRVTVLLKVPPAGDVQYDTAQATPPTGSAKDIAAALKPLMGAKVEVTMNDLGGIVDARPIQEEPPGKAASPTASLLSKGAIQQLLKQPLAELRKEAVQPGDNWQTSGNLTTALGPGTQKTNYEYKGPIESDGRKLEQIETKTTLDIPPAAKITLKDHMQTGKVLFDSAAGRVVSAEQSQKLVTERPYRETTIVVTLATDTKSTVTPTRQSGAAKE